MLNYELQKNKITTLEKEQEIHQMKIKQMADIVQTDHDKLNVLIDLAVRHDERIHQIENAETYTQSRAMKFNLIINGVKQEPDEDVKHVAQNFLTQQLKHDKQVEIEDAF